MVGPISQDTGHVHIQEHEDGWQIFVPQTRDAKEICYMGELPHALTSLFKISITAGESIGHVLNSRLSLLDELMVFDGIGMVPGFEAPQRRESIYEDRDEVEEERFGENAEEIDPELREPGRVPSTPSSSSSEHSPGLNRTPPRSVSPVIQEEHGFTRNAYRELLSHVIRIARQAVLPHRNAAVLETGQFHPGYVHDNTFGVRNQGQMNHDVKIGAAGELYVSALDLESSYLSLQY